MEDARLSKRGFGNVEAIWPRISKAAAERDEIKTGTPVIDLSTSENWLIRKEIIELYKKAVQDSFGQDHLSYPAFTGDADLVDALVDFFNTYFKPHTPVEKNHVAVAPGAAFALDGLLYNICEPGDGLLIPAPFWNGFDWLLNVKASVQPIVVNVDSFGQVFSDSLIPALEKAYAEAERPVKGVLFTNPHNPFGQCYPRETIEAVIRFCSQRDIHFISDELYALSNIKKEFEEDDGVPFISALEINVGSLGCNLARVHTIWSSSKDLGSSGLRMGCCITQGNRPLAVGLSLASNTQMSSLTAVVTTALLRSADFPALLKLSSVRLGAAYLKLTSFLDNHKIPYIPARMGPFLFAKVARHADSWDEEADFTSKCKEAGVSLSSGKAYHVVASEKGWARITFAVDPVQLDEALKRLEGVLVS